MEFTGKLPDGIASVSNEDWGVGALLVIRLQNGMTVALDCLHLGDTEAQVTVSKESADGEPDFLASIAFDAQGVGEVYKAKR
jgi:hypothetical protein